MLNVIRKDSPLGNVSYEVGYACSVTGSSNSISVAFTTASSDLFLRCDIWIILRRRRGRGCSARAKLFFCLLSYPCLFKTVFSKLNFGMVS